MKRAVILLVFGIILLASLASADLVCNNGGDNPLSIGLNIEDPYGPTVLSPSKESHEDCYILAGDVTSIGSATDRPLSVSIDERGEITLTFEEDVSNVLISGVKYNAVPEGTEVVFTDNGAKFTLANDVELVVNSEKGNLVAESTKKNSEVTLKKTEEKGYQVTIEDSSVILHLNEVGELFGEGSTDRYTLYEEELQTAVDVYEPLEIVVNSYKINAVSTTEIYFDDTLDLLVTTINNQLTCREKVYVDSYAYFETDEGFALYVWQDKCNTKIELPSQNQKAAENYAKIYSEENENWIRIQLSRIAQNTDSGNVNSFYLQKGDTLTLESGEDNAYIGTVDVTEGNEGRGKLSVCSVQPNSGGISSRLGKNSKISFLSYLGKEVVPEEEEASTSCEITACEFTKGPVSSESSYYSLICGQDYPKFRIEATAMEDLSYDGDTWSCNNKNCFGGLLDIKENAWGFGNNEGGDFSVELFAGAELSTLNYFKSLTVNEDRTEYKLESDTFTIGDMRFRPSDDQATISSGSIVVSIIGGHAYRLTTNEKNKLFFLRENGKEPYIFSMDYDARTEPAISSIDCGVCQERAQSIGDNNQIDIYGCTPKTARNKGRFYTADEGKFILEHPQNTALAASSTESSSYCKAMSVSDEDEAALPKLETDNRAVKEGQPETFNQDTRSSCSVEKTDWSCQCGAKEWLAIGDSNVDIDLWDDDECADEAECVANNKCVGTDSSFFCCSDEAAASKSSSVRGSNALNAVYEDGGAVDPTGVALAQAGGLVETGERLLDSRGGDAAEDEPEGENDEEDGRDDNDPPEEDTDGEETLKIEYFYWFSEKSGVYGKAPLGNTYFTEFDKYKEFPIVKVGSFNFRKDFYEFTKAFRDEMVEKTSNTDVLIVDKGNGNYVISGKYQGTTGTVDFGECKVSYFGKTDTVHRWDIDILIKCPDQAHSSFTIDNKNIYNYNNPNWDYIVGYDIDDYNMDPNIWMDSNFDQNANTISITKPI